MLILLVEPGLQLDDRRHLLPVLRGPPQRPDDRGVLPDSVKRLLDREHVRVIGRRVQKIHDHGERVVGVVQEHVPLADDRKDILVGGEPLGDPRVEGRVLVRRVHGEVVEGKEITDIDRAVDFVDKPLLDAELPGEELDNLLRGAGVDLEPDRDLVRAVPDLGLNRFEKIHHFILVEIVIMVPGDPERDDVFNLHSGKQPMDMSTDEVFEKDEMVSLHFHICGNKPRQDRRDFDKGVGLGHLYSARFLKNNEEVQTEIAEKREGVSCIDGQRRQNGEDLRLEVFIEPLDLFFVELVDPVKEDPCLFESRQHLLHDATVLLGNQAAYSFCDFVKLLPDCSAARIEAIHFRVQDAEEPADTDHEVLVQVRAEDGGELEFFERGGEFILSLLEHPPVELKPGKFAINIEKRIIEIDRLRLFCGSGGFL